MEKLKLLSIFLFPSLSDFVVRRRFLVTVTDQCLVSFAFAKMAQNGGDGNDGGGAATHSKKFEAPQPHSVKEQLPGIQYCINSSPPWPEAIILGFQHYLLTLGITVLIPSIIVPQMGGGNTEKAAVIQNLLFVSGLSTLFQTFLGTRLPIVVVGSYAYLIPVTSIIQASRYTSYSDPYERFVRTMRGIQGALIGAAFFQCTIGFLGLWRNAVRFLSPLSVVPYVTFTGLGLYHLGFPMVIVDNFSATAAISCYMILADSFLFPHLIKLAKCVEIGIPGIILMVFISQILPRYLESKRSLCGRFSILFSISITWLFAQLLTSTTVYKHKPENTQISCRTDRAGLISTAPWIYFPYPFQWGSPTFNAGDAIVMMAPAFVSLFESTGTFFAAARFGSATPVPPSVISRGAGWLGIGVLLNGCLGSVTGTTASVENVGLLALTRVGSRRVIQISAGFMIFFSIFAKFGAFFASVPLPIVAAVYCVLFSFVSSAGLSFLQFCNLNSFKTKFILGFSFFMGLSVPQYFREYFHGGWRSAHPTGLFSDIAVVIFMSHTTVAALVALFFDLTLCRENDESRKDIGLNWWEKFSFYKSDVRNDEFYALPFRLNKLFPSI
ncbi:Xanthine/uracil/vitamin C permease [Gossypium australe]|uniref:Xanthine/uracil/vitamin C permease n=1 Tax=Gossypium australe TaxID=47621 RepID=A0A5B6U685_9ROSI|nr:Xanthine/uracil/vitamin C permease [Gossypium australe]